MKHVINMLLYVLSGVWTRRPGEVGCAEHWEQQREHQREHQRGAVAFDKEFIYSMCVIVSDIGASVCRIAPFGCIK